MRACAYRDCAAPVPPNARFCPRCGRPRAKGGRFVVFGLFLVLAVGVLFFLGFAQAVKRPETRGVAPTEILDSRDPAPNPWPNDSRLSHR